MSRKIKNIIMIFLIIGVGIGMFFTYKSTIKSVKNSDNKFSINDYRGTPPDMDNNSNTDKSNRRGNRENRSDIDTSNRPARDGMNV